MGRSRLAGDSAYIWNTQAALADTPPGAYFQVIDPILKANDLAYCASVGPEYKAECDNQTIPPALSGGSSWERVYDLETSQSTAGGPHALVFADHEQKRAIFVIRGSCLEGLMFEQCNVDMCFMNKIKAFGMATPMVYGQSANLSKCPEYESDGKLDYIEQSDTLVKQAQERLPGYAFLLTGHSMGGFLTTVVGALHPGVFKVMTYAPSPYHPYLKEIGWSDEKIAGLAAQDLIAMCDPFDCGVNSAFVAQARVGGTTCIIFGTEEPEPCATFVNNNDTPYLTQDSAWRGDLQILTAFPCKGEAHSFHRYMRIVHERSSKNSDSPAFLPTCSLDYSMISALGV